MRAWVDHNLHSLGLALHSMRAQPFATLFSVLVIGIALALPAGLYLALHNLEKLSGGLSSEPELSLFLKPELDSTQGRALVQELSRHPAIRTTRFFTRDEGLKRLGEAGLADLTAGLEGNPLPDTIIIGAKAASPEAIDRLAAELRSRVEVEQVLVDSDWTRRLAALLEFGRDLVLLLAATLGLALAAITGNTIRLQIYAAREEIEVSRLIGATDRFIRRPFLYFGTLQGLLGGVAGWALVSGALALLGRSLSRFAEAWGLPNTLVGLGWLETTVLLGGAALLGLLGAYFAVGHSLRKLL